MVASWPNSLAAYVAALTECGYTIGFTDPRPASVLLFDHGGATAVLATGLRTQREYKESIGRRLAAR